MKTVSIFVILITLSVSISAIYYFKSGGRNINADISALNKLSAKELIKLSNSYVDEYWGKRTYYVGKINMTLDENLEGKVEIWYKDDNKDKNGVPNIITVEIDTKKNKILRIINQERNSKIVPGDINIDKWSVDSINVIDIARKNFTQDNDFNFTTAWLSATSIDKNEKEIWNVSFYNENTKRAYYLEIDAYTGEIYRSEVK